ncbi:hypothetical protein [Sinorhizobium saheli]|uniref:hypothetical protein n=1 Tax=Sinorhizobium saheli TaxID=36856 RepID=UPI001295E85B|nr:hypothetical protein [Sinorhizobium saheli]MQW87583.1 hypothetical protein [Sinorhizobium saheli]
MKTESNFSAYSIVLSPCGCVGDRDFRSRKDCRQAVIADVLTSSAKRREASVFMTFFRRAAKPEGKKKGGRGVIARRACMSS